MSLHNPCDGCTERFIACSDRCPKDQRGEYGYKAWKADLQAQQKYLKDNRNRWGVPMTSAREKAYAKYKPNRRKYSEGGSYE